MSQAQLVSFKQPCKIAHGSSFGLDSRDKKRKKPTTTRLALRSGPVSRFQSRPGVGFLRAYILKSPWSSTRETWVSPAGSRPFASRPAPIFALLDPRSGFGLMTLICGPHTMGHNLSRAPCWGGWTYFDVHQGYRVLTHSHSNPRNNFKWSPQAV